ncbi:hypothetical protein M902_1011 [Bacteriovorax sp. BAL6_X]|uniref:hypothetical protein n=1 Tax=Bacteriovorax sp. BAL6_X TaxID=1201290 RepID=UPI000386ED6C|nr:hypothetical protein [Bacteriovorax sp. BAL6_X]EPZ50133.1 hypothetical protein M902_1011 [Bacteriovorax sp. BAL6_X]
MKKHLLFLFTLCTLSTQAKIYYAPDGSQYELSKCQKECMEKLAQEMPTRVLQIVEGSRYRDFLLRQTLSKYLEKENINYFDKLYKDSAYKDSWVLKKRHATEMSISLKDFSEDQKLTAAIDYIKNNPDKAKENYNLITELGQLVAAKNKSEYGISSSEKELLNELDKQNKINLSELIQDLTYYDTTKMNGLYDLLSFEKKQNVICQHIDEEVASFSEYMTEDCREYDECVQLTESSISSIKENFKEYLTYTCDGSSLSDNIDNIREHAKETLSYMFPDIVAKQGYKTMMDECYDCGITKTEDYIIDIRIVKEANKFFKVTKRWTQGCDELERESLFYNMEKRALRKLRKHPNLKINDAQTKSSTCRVRLDANN